MGIVDVHKHHGADKASTNRLRETTEPVKTSHRQQKFKQQAGVNLVHGLASLVVSPHHQRDCSSSMHGTAPVCIRPVFSSPPHWSDSSRSWDSDSAGERWRIATESRARALGMLCCSCIAWRRAPGPNPHLMHLPFLVTPSAGCRLGSP